MQDTGTYKTLDLCVKSTHANMKILIFIVLNSVVTQTVALETETIYKPPTLDELVGIEIARFDVRNGKDGEFFCYRLTFVRSTYFCIN